MQQRQRLTRTHCRRSERVGRCLRRSKSDQPCRRCRRDRTPTNPECFRTSIRECRQRLLRLGYNWLQWCQAQWPNGAELVTENRFAKTDSRKPNPDSEIANRNSGIVISELQLPNRSSCIPNRVRRSGGRRSGRPGQPPADHRRRPSDPPTLRRPPAGARISPGADPPTDPLPAAQPRDRNRRKHSARPQRPTQLRR